jgi:hypothetical protein
VEALGCARHMRNWMLAQPRKRSTSAGIGRRIVTWWQREQERAARGQSPYAQAGGGPSATRKAVDTLQSLRRPDA